MGILYCVCVQAPTLITVLPTHVSVRDIGLQANPALIKIGQSPNVPITGPEGTDKSPMGSPPPSNPPTSNNGAGGDAAEAIGPGITFSLLP